MSAPVPVPPGTITPAVAVDPNGAVVGSGNSSSQSSGPALMRRLSSLFGAKKSSSSTNALSRNAQNPVETHSQALSQSEGLPQPHSQQHQRNQQQFEQERKMPDIRSVFGWTDVPQQNGMKTDSNIAAEVRSRCIQPAMAPAGPQPLLSQQKQLPRLPVPPLEETCEQYLRSLSALLSPGEMVRSRMAVDAFMRPGGDGAKLQAWLEERAAAPARASWLEEFWDDAYLRGRDPIPVNVNYFFVFEDDPNPARMELVPRAAALLHGMLKFKERMDAPNLDLDTERGISLDMSQYPRIFSTSRVPGRERDSIIQYSPRGKFVDSLDGGTVSEHVDADPDHVVVLCRDRFFKVQVFTQVAAEAGKQPTRTALSVDALERALEACRVAATGPLPTAHAGSGGDDLASAVDISFEGIDQVSDPSGAGSKWLAESSFVAAETDFTIANEALPVGVLTTLDRTAWAIAREELIAADPSHAQQLETIQSAIFVICLDDKCATESWDETSRLLLHGTGTNRWFDRSQLVVDARGRAGINFEHSIGDGATTLRLADEMFSHSVSCRDSNTGGGANINVAPEELVWRISANHALFAKMRPALESYARRVLEVDSATLVFQEYGGTVIKEKARLSPDGFVQVALQLAYFRLFGRFDATYEAASTRMFLHGRTETVRSTTAEAVSFVHAAMGPIFPLDRAHDSGSVLNETPRQLLLLREAVDAHVKYMRAAKEGYGVDRHLFALRILAEQAGIEPRPEIFADPAYVRSSRWALSTSHCGSPALSLFGFGPVVADGLGVGYMIKGSTMSFNVTSLHGHTSLSTVFCSCLKQCLVQLHSIILAAPSNLKKPSVSLHFTHPTSSAQVHIPARLNKGAN